MAEHAHTTPPPSAYPACACRHAGHGQGEGMTPHGAIMQLGAIAAILLALGMAPLDEGDPGAALIWLGGQLDDARAVLADGVTP